MHAHLVLIKKLYWKTIWENLDTVVGVSLWQQFSEQQRPEKCVHVVGVYGLFSINGTLQADKSPSLIYSQVGYNVFGVV